MERLKKTSEKSACKKSRTFKCIPLSKRVEILKFLEAGHRQVEAATQFKVSTTAVRRMVQNKENILKAQKSLEQQQGNKNKCRLTGIEDSVFEKTLFSWFIHQRDSGAPVSGPMIREQALLINEKLGGSDSFKASAGWLHGFKQRHGIRILSVQGDQLPENHKDSEEFCMALQSIIEVEGYSLEQIYHAERTSLQWKTLPKKTLAARNKTTPSEWKDVKDRITIVMCANAAGTHKMPLLVIGKSKEPRCFKNVKVFPVQYTNQRNACMDGATFIPWYKNIFLPSVKERQKKNDKFLLLVDNAPAHPSEETLNAIDECCSVINLPTNVTSRVQSMEEGCTEVMKRFYRKHFLLALLLHDTMVGPDNVMTFLEKWNLISCFNALSRAWDDISQTTLQNAWKNLLQESEEDMLEEEVEELVYLGSQTLSEHTFSAGDALLSNVVEEVASSESEKGTGDSRPQSPNEETNEPTAISALAALNEYQRWYMQQEGARHNILLQINRMQTFAERCIFNNDGR